jgi:hypothetical protein
MGDEKRLGAGAPVWLTGFPRFSSPCELAQLLRAPAQRMGNSPRASLIERQEVCLTR